MKRYAVANILSESVRSDLINAASRQNASATDTKKPADTMDTIAILISRIVPSFPTPIGVQVDAKLGYQNNFNGSWVGSPGLLPKS